LWRKYSYTQNFDDYLRFAQKRNLIRRLTRQLRVDYEAGIAKSIRHNPKCFWNYVQSKIRVKPSIPNLNSCDGAVSTDNNKAIILNSFFTSVFTREDLDSILDIDSFHFREPLTDVSITSEQICEKLRSLKPCKPAGPDGIHPIFLPKTAAELSKPLYLIFRKSLDNGFLPVDWKVGNVIPVFKKGNCHSLENYRPISLTSVVCKIFESIIRENIISHMPLTICLLGSNMDFSLDDLV